MTRSCPMMENSTAAQNALLENRPNWNTDLVADLQDKALNMSKKTKQVKVMVVSLLVILPSSIISLNTYSVPHTMIDADRRILSRMSRDSMACFTSLGGFFIKSLSAGSTPRL